MTFPVQVGPSTITINRDDRVLVSQPDGRILGDSDGFFTRDTRFISGYDLLINGQRPVLLGSTPIRFFSSRHEFTNDPLVDAAGPCPAPDAGPPPGPDRRRRGPRGLRPRQLRAPARAAHDRDRDPLGFRGHLRRQGRPARASRRAEHALVPVTTRAADDLRQPRLQTRARHRRRKLHLAAPVRQRPPGLRRRRSRPRGTGTPAFDGCRSPARTGGSRRSIATRSTRRCARSAPGTCRMSASRRRIRPSIEPGTRRSVDLEALRLEDPAFERGVFIPAAGVPWFVTLFGRDSLIVSMQGISGFPEFASGALRRLSGLQATEDDPERDMEPGKIPHEIRHGELAQLEILPYQPYYGTHDATSLFVIVLSYLYHWGADPELLRRYLPNAEAAVTWIDRYGDRDRDGFQEYKTRSSHGHYNQGWKDSGDAIVEADGTLSPLPSPPASCRATCSTRRSAWPMSTTYSAGRRTPSASVARRRSCSTASTRRSGGKPRGPTTWASTVARSPSVPWPPMPVTCSSRASSRRTGRNGSSGG